MAVKQKNPNWMNEVRKNRRSLLRKKVAIGWPKGTDAVSITYPNGTPVLSVAVWNQFGATARHPGGTRYVIGGDGKSRFVRNDFVGPVSGITGPHEINIPPRDFMRPGGRNASEKAGAILRKHNKDVNAGKVDGTSLLEQAAAVGVAELQKAITDLSDPPNAPSTVARKKSSNPLVNTRAMTQSITWAIR